jgi:predicted O-linked N-acetylglucosamine transferase (SPINDLY family)
MGAPYMDYLIADKVLIPEESRIHYSEKVAYLPHSYQVNDTKRQIAETPYTREAMGLPSEGFVFCCFNNSFKITPHTFDGWMRILQAVPGSVLWLLDDNPHASQNLRKEASARGVDAERLVFGGRMPLPEHLARQRLADLFLDTLPCNAHTTASDALWAGLPVLTLMGQSFAGRVAASLLMAMELPELVADSQDDYERRAIGWALAPEPLRALRQKLQGNRLTTPLYDTPRFTRHIEQAFVQMHARRLAGLPADHIEIRP